MRLTIKHRGGHHAVEVEDDPTFAVEIDGKPVVGVLLDNGDNDPLYNIGHWPDGEEWVPLVESVLPRPSTTIKVKPEYEHLVRAVMETWSGATREDFDPPGPQEYLRGQVELLVEAGAVQCPEFYDGDDIRQWLTSHLITRIINANTKESA